MSPPAPFPLFHCGKNSAADKIVEGTHGRRLFSRGGGEREWPKKNNTTNNGYRGGDTFGRPRGGVEDRGERGAGKPIFYKKSGKIVKKNPAIFSYKKGQLSISKTTKRKNIKNHNCTSFPWSYFLKAPDFRL